MLQKNLKDLIDKNGLGGREIIITDGTQTGTECPNRRGQEKQMEACFGCSYGQAFTDETDNYRGKIEELSTMPLQTNFERAVFTSGLNSVLRELKMADHTVHCTGSSAKECSIELVEMIEKEYGQPKIAMFGMQKLMAKFLSEKFAIRIFDLDEDNIGKEKFGIKIESGICDMEEVESWADVFIVTGSTMSNGTIVHFLNIKKPVIYFGITIAGAATLLGLKRFCPQST